MNLSLPSQLREFVAKKVLEGGYSSQSDVVFEALRGLRERDLLLRGSATKLDSASPSPYDRAISNMGLEGSVLQFRFHPGAKLRQHHPRCRLFWLGITKTRGS